MSDGQQTSFIELHEEASFDLPWRSVFIVDGSDFSNADYCAGMVRQGGPMLGQLFHNFQR